MAAPGGDGSSGPAAGQPPASPLATTIGASLATVLPPGLTAALGGEDRLVPAVAAALPLCVVVLALLGVCV